jgi:sigma-B regulation protein RsbU (phosphoserine phosphatase)
VVAVRNVPVPVFTIGSAISILFMTYAVVDQQLFNPLLQLNRQLQEQFVARNEELAMARKIQQSLLPPPKPNWACPDVVCYCIPAHEVGGDFYFYHAFDLSQDSGPAKKFTLAVGDVSGKGMPAALLMGVSSTLFEATLNQALSPGELLARLDEAFFPYGETTAQNCALICLEITPLCSSALEEEPKEGLMCVANAGCISPIVRRADGTVEWIDVRGLPLGTGLQLQQMLGYQEAQLKLSKGDMVILISDGVVEAKNEVDEMFGFERVQKAVKSGPQTSAEAMLNHLKAKVTAFFNKTEPEDDLTIVVARM